MKKIAGIFLMLCLIVPFFGTYGWLRYHTRLVKREVKRRMIEGMEKDDLTELTFTRNQTERILYWKHSKEFEYNGQMYDVVYKRESGDSVHYWCWADNKETRLNQLLNNLVMHVLGNMPQRKEAQRQLANFLANLFHSEIPKWRVHLLLNDKLNSSSFDFIYSFASPSPPAPPPEIA